MAEEKTPTPKRMAAKLMLMALQRAYNRVNNCSPDDLSTVLGLAKPLSDDKKMEILAMWGNIVETVATRLNTIVGGDPVDVLLLDDKGE